MRRKNFVVPGLDRQIHVLADGAEVGHRVDDVVGHVLRMRGQEPEPGEPGNCVDRPQQIGQTRIVGKVMPIGIDRLTEQRHLAHAAGGQPLDLGHDVGHRAAPLFAAAIGNDAVGAEEIAAVDDRDER